LNDEIYFLFAEEFTIPSLDNPLNNPTKIMQSLNQACLSLMGDCSLPSLSILVSLKVSKSIFCAIVFFNEADILESSSILIYSQIHMGLYTQMVGEKLL
jgi:hypothetical protein